MSGCRISIGCACALLLAGPARAVLGVGDVVFDPTIHGWNLLHESRETMHWAEQLKQFEDLIARQIRTIEELSDLKNGVHSRLGDWKGVYDRAVSLRNRADRLKATIGENFSVVAVVDVGQPALVYSNHGLYPLLNVTTQYGTRVELPDDRLKRYEAVYRRQDDLEKSMAAANQEIGEILAEVAAASAEIVAATSQEQAVKLQEKKATLQLRLQELQRQFDAKLKLLQAQATVNENRAQLEREVARERLKQTWQESRARDAAWAEK